MWYFMKYSVVDLVFALFPVNNVAGPPLVIFIHILADE